MKTQAGQPSTAADLLTEQFYRWEVRGRGWMVWDEPVDLEPPFRPFEGHYLPRVVQDDGVLETGLSRFAKEFLGRFGAAPETASAPSDEIDEPSPEYVEELAELVELQVSLPREYKAEHEVFEQCLLNLHYCQWPLAFEVVGTQEGLVAQVVAEAGDAELVAAQVKGHFPEAVVQPARGYVEAQCRERARVPREIVDFGLDQEFMRPLNTMRLLATDPLVGLCAALERLGGKEMGVFQVLFKPVRARWGEQILRAVTTDGTEPFFAQAPELVSQARMKLASPLFAVVVRAAAWCPDAARVWEIIRGLAGVLTLFASPNGNELVPLESDDYPAGDHEADFLRRCSRRSGMLLNSGELVSLAHLPTAAVRSRKLKREVKRTKEAPPLATGKGVCLGENVHEGSVTPVTLTPEQRTRHMHVIGASGTGKSTFLLNLIVQDMEHGDGVAVLDPHGDLVEDVLRRVPEGRFGDVILFDPSDQEYPVGFNILSAHSELERNLLEGDLAAAFERLSTSWGDQMTAVLGNAIMALLESPRGGTLADLRRFLLEDRFRRQYLTDVRDAEILYYWTRQFPLLAGKPQASVVTRLDRFLRPKPIRYMVCQRESRLDFAEIMNRGKIFLAKLPQGLIGEENSYLLGTLLVAKFHQMAIGRQSLEAQQRRDFWLYVDEFHNFITPSMASILSGARKYRLGLVLAHQDFGQLRHQNAEVGSAVMTNPYTRVCFRLGDEDAKRFAEGFSCFTAEDFENLGIGEAICRIERREFDFNLCVTPLAKVPKECADAKAEIRRRSREAYGTPREKVAEELAKLWTFRTEESADEGDAGRLASGQRASVESSAPAPITPPVLPSPPAPPIASQSGRSAVADAAFSTQAPPPKWATKAGPSVPPADLGRGGAQHQILQMRIKGVAEGLGYKVTVEKPVLDNTGSIDLALEKPCRSIACEISITTTIDHEVGNVRKCLKAGFAQVAVVCVTEHRLHQITAAVEGCLGKEEAARVGYYTPDQFIVYLQSTTLEDAKSAPSPPMRKRGYIVKRSAATHGVQEATAREEAMIKMVAKAMRRKG